MKIIFSTLLLCTAVLSDLPYPQRGFRPSPQFQNSPSRYQQNLYRPANVDLRLNSKLTIEQLISLTEQLQSRSKLSQLRPPSARQPQIIYGPPQNRPPSTSYGVPDIKNAETFDRQLGQEENLRQTFFNNLHNRQPSTKLNQQYSPPQFGQNTQSEQTQNSFSESNNVQNHPSQQYLPPQTSQPSGGQQPTNSYAGSSIEGQNIQPTQQFVPSKSFAGQNIQPSQQFLPSGQQQPQNSIEGQNIQPTQQFGPTRVQPSKSFAGQNIQPSQQFLPSGQRQPQNSFGVSSNGQQPQNVGVNNGFGSDFNTNNVAQSYLPPQTTPRSAVETTLRPSSVATTTASVDETTGQDYDYDQQQTSLDSEGSAGPNISISNAVAGGGNFFYLQQPDGRLQKVILKKTQEPNSKPEEYVANYYFENIQALPNTFYAPLINLGGYLKK